MQMSCRLSKWTVPFSCTVATSQFTQRINSSNSLLSWPTGQASAPRRHERPHKGLACREGAATKVDILAIKKTSHLAHAISALVGPTNDFKRRPWAGRPTIWLLQPRGSQSAQQSTLESSTVQSLQLQIGIIWGCKSTCAPVVGKCSISSSEREIR